MNFPCLFVNIYIYKKKMFCSICSSPEDEGKHKNRVYVIIVTCGHYCCIDCYERILLTDQKICPLCRHDFMKDLTPTILTRDIRPGVENFSNINVAVTDDDRHHTQFDLLFSNKYELEYELAVARYTNLWGFVSQDTYTYGQVCYMCLNHKQSQISKLLNIYYNTMPCTVETIIDAAVVSLLSIKGISFTRLSPKDVAYHYFYNNCVMDNSTSTQKGYADILCLLQNNYVLNNCRLNAGDLNLALLSGEIKTVRTGTIKPIKCSCYSVEQEMANITKTYEQEATATDNKKKSYFLFQGGVQSAVDGKNNYEKANDNRLNIVSCYRDLVIQPDQLEDDDSKGRETDPETGEEIQPVARLQIFAPYIDCEICTDSCKSSSYSRVNDMESAITNLKTTVLRGSNGPTIVETMLSGSKKHIENYINSQTELENKRIYDNKELLSSCTNEEDEDDEEEEEAEETDSNYSSFSTTNVVSSDSIIRLGKKKFTAHFVSCTYNRRRFIPFFKLFKSVDQLKNQDFVSHTFTKLFSNRNRLLCMDTDIATFIVKNKHPDAHLPGSVARYIIAVGKTHEID